MKITLQCVGCGKDLERMIKVDNPRCFPCKKELKRLYGIEYKKINPHTYIPHPRPPKKKEIDFFARWKLRHDKTAQ